MKDQSKSGSIEFAPVSVIIPCYRCADTIQRAVDSVVAQTLPPQEIILVDDFSNDKKKTLNALNRLQHEYQGLNIKILCLENNSGPGSARNAGWHASTQLYLAFLDADDSWHPKKLEIQYQWMAAHSNVVLSGHSSVSLTMGASMQDLPEKLVSHRVTRNDLLISNRFPTRSVMLKRELSFRFIPGKRYSEDYLLWLTVVCSNQDATFLKMPMAYSYKKEFGDGGLSGDLWKFQQGELDTYKRLCKNNYISFFALIFLYIFSFLKFFRRWSIVQWRVLGNDIF
ncbi:glycosyltransferase family 2 protein [Methylotenera sp.]|uniref:glycosyltransferase family 2 protein n=1 Tax=Methylotenera sp. TaxID=2051956 RepID=UPI00271D5A20|nr:glycosyltransferase family 2 protein [Methylotenera sp.]MDO9204845.1 glycosyltransferase family 2 protein [Methylotenera sp.]MDP1523959.1 glycosyltransferase family 2 protein [Methylotenera sp.]